MLLACLVGRYTHRTLIILQHVFDKCPVGVLAENDAKRSILPLQAVIVINDVQIVR